MAAIDYIANKLALDASPVSLQLVINIGHFKLFKLRWNNVQSLFHILQKRNKRQSYPFSPKPKLVRL